MLTAAPCPQDPLTTLREQCEQIEKCVKARERLELCNERVSSRSQTEEQCTEELFDFLHARDHCVSAAALSRAAFCPAFLFNVWFLLVTTDLAGISYITKELNNSNPVFVPCEWHLSISVLYLPF